MVKWIESCAEAQLQEYADEDGQAMFLEVAEALRALPKLVEIAQAAEQAVETIDKVLTLTDAYINVNISGKDFRFDPTGELKQKLAALHES